MEDPLGSSNPLPGSRLGSEEGSALMAAFWMLVVLLLAGMAASFTTTTEISLSGNDRMEAQLFYLAEAGVAQTKRWIDALGQPFEGTGPTRTAPMQVFFDEPIGAAGVQGRFTAYVDKQEWLNGRPTKYLAITVRAQISSVPMVKVLQVHVAQDNFAKYAYFTDEENDPVLGTPVWFTTGDVLRGPVHTNGQLNIDGDPVFIDVVSSVSSSINYAAGTNTPDFKKGVQLGADRIELPSDTSLLQSKAQEADGLHLTGNADVQIIYDAVLDYSFLRVNQAMVTTDYQLPLNGVFYVDGDCHIRGTLKGQMTVGCSGNMYITSDIFYTTDPRVDPTSTDLLGLVAEGNIMMSANPANLDVGDETVMAVMLALNTSFGAQNHTLGTPRGYLRVVGGVLQLKRGPIGTYDLVTGNLITGYEKDYVYDTRLADSPPPAFPTTGRALTLAWKELEPGYDISQNVF